MKKIFTLIAGAVLALGLASCSGNLHDVEDPNKMEGNWFYYELDTSTATANTISIIFSDGGDCQTKDITDVPKTGSVYYLWAAATKTDTAVVSLRSDNPDKGFGSDKLGVYVFTNASKCMLWAWDSGANFTGGTWPGEAMLSDTVAATPTAIATFTVEASGSEYVKVGTTYWFSGLSWDAGWPYNNWSGNSEYATDEDHAKYRAVATSDGVKWDGPFTIEVDKNTEKQIEFKFIDIVDANLATGDPTFNPANMSATIPAISEDTSFKLVITCTKDDLGLNADVKVEKVN